MILRFGLRDSGALGLFSRSSMTGYELGPTLKAITGSVSSFVPAPLDQTL